MNERKPSTGGLLRTVVRGAGLAGVGYALAQALTLASYLVLARLISPGDFGDFAAASILVNAGMLFTESGMLAALIHRRDRIEEAASTAVIATLAAGLLFGLIALVASPLVGAFFDSDTIATVSAALAGLLPLRALPIVPEALLQRRFLFLRRMVSEPAAVVAFGTVAIIAASNGMGVWALVLGYYASAVTDIILSWALVRWRPRLGLASFAVWRELVSYGRHVLAATAILRAGSQVPNALLGRYVGTAPLGQYRYADRIASTPFSAILAAASWVLFPAFARISHESERFREAFLRSLRSIMALAVPFGMVLLPLGVPVAVVVFGPVWYDAGEAAMALCLYTGAASLISIATEAFKAAGRPELLTRTHLLTVVCGSILMVALLPFGLVGVAAGISLGMVAGAAYAVVASGRVMEISRGALLGCIWPAAAAASVMAAALFGVEYLLDAESHSTAAGLALLAAEGAIGAAVYIPLLLVLDPAMKEELRSLRTNMRRGGARPADDAYDPHAVAEEPYAAGPGTTG